MSTNDKKQSNASGESVSSDQAYVSQIYHASAKQNPSEKLDASVLAAAKNMAAKMGDKRPINSTDVQTDAKAKPREIPARSIWYKWHYSGAIAAGILLVVFFIGQDNIPDVYNDDLLSGSEPATAENVQDFVSPKIEDDALVEMIAATRARNNEADAAMAPAEAAPQAELEAQVEEIVVTGSIVSKEASDDDVVDRLYTKADELLIELLDTQKAVGSLTKRFSALSQSMQTDAFENTEGEAATAPPLDIVYIEKQKELYDTLIEIRALEGEQWELEEEFTKVLNQKQIEALQQVRG